MESTVHKQKQRRSRNIQMIVRMTSEEKEFILKKMKRANLENFNLYALRMLITGEVKNVDFIHYHELAKEVSRIGTNINQIARLANVSGVLYPTEIAALQQQMEDIWRLLKSSLSEQR
jgi:hypothetical protein